MKIKNFKTTCLCFENMESPADISELQTDVYTDLNALEKKAEYSKKEV